MMIANYGRSAMPSLMGLAGSAEIIKLQQSLANLAVATGRPEFAPGRTDGVLDDATMAGVAAAVSVAANELPSWLATALQIALVGGAATQTAKNYVSQYAAQLSVAFNTAAVKYKKAPVPVAPTPAVFVTPWFKTWWGITGIVVGGLFVLRFIFAPRAQ